MPTRRLLPQRFVGALALASAAPSSGCDDPAHDEELPLLLGLLRFVLNASGPIKQPLGVQRVPQIIGSKRLPRRCRCVLILHQ